MARTRVVIDTDPGVDDAVAILLALASPELDVLALTTVTGNVDLAKTTLNARRLLDLANRPDVLVAAGCSEALAGPTNYSGDVHGSDGLGDLDWDEPDVMARDEHAVELLHRLIGDGPLVIVAIGPLTNLAVLLERHPDDARALERIVIMGGASFEGNVTPSAEFNIWADPEAAQRVFDAEWPITIMPLDLTHQAKLNDADLAYFSDLGTEVGRRTAQMLEPYALFHQRWYGNRDVIMHDALAVYELLDPELITKQGVRVTIETSGTYSRGATWFDRRREHADSRVRVGLEVDNKKFVALLRERLSSFR
jgi:purine nucleosidase